MQRTKLLAVLIGAVLCAGASSCASRVEIRPTFPPVADLRTDPEPEYPLAALMPDEQGERAEEAWMAKMLTWGRDHHDRVKRICIWSTNLGLKVPPGYCDK